MNYVQLISIILEAVIAILLLNIAMRNKPTLYGLTITFTIYVLYDLSRLFSLNISEQILTGIFLVATLSALYSVWYMYKEK